MTSDKALFAAIRAMPHMAITKQDGQYRITSIAAADQRQHSADWHRDHAERVAYYTTDRADALGTARSLSAQMVRFIERLSSREAGR